MQWLIRFILTLSCLCLHADDRLPEPYASVKELLPFNPQGWYSNKKQIEKLIQQRGVKTVIEVGSWMGTSTIHMASRLPEGGRVYAVDHWLGSTEHQGWKEVPTLYEQFLSNVIHAGLTHKITPLRMDSLEAAGLLHDVCPDLIYIDASHDKQSVLEDLRAWFPYVKGRGVLCGDDWDWEGVQGAVSEFAKENRLKIEHTHSFWRLIEKK